MHFTLDYTPLHSATPHCTTLHSIAIHYHNTNITPPPQQHHKCNSNYATLITPHSNYKSKTLQLQLQLRYTTLHPEVVAEVTDQVTSATTATTPTTPLQPPSSPSVGSLCCPCISTSHLSYSLLSLKLSLPPCAVLVCLCTSSTAQGGGESFKDRKPIGGVRCCEAWMAKQIR